MEKIEIEKINISKEIVEIGENQTFVNFIKENNENFRMMEVNETPRETDIETRITEKWLVVEIKDMYNNLKKYLVKSDNRELFKELIVITNSLLKKKIRRETQSIRENTISEIKDLSFLKRLFNKF